MGRPKEFDSEMVLEAAKHCFWADGVERTSISSLVEAMQIQRSSFYNSFSSRDGILGQILERYLDSSPFRTVMGREEATGAEAPDLQLIDLIIDFSHFLVEEGKGRGCLFLNGLGELKPESGLAYEIFHDQYVGLTDGLSHLLGRVNYSSQTPEATGPLSLPHVMCILFGMAHYSKLDGDAQKLAEIGLDQLSGLSRHFAELIKSRNALKTDQEADHKEAEKRLQA